MQPPSEDLFDKLIISSQGKTESTYKNIVDKLFSKKGIHKKTDLKEKEIHKLVLLQVIAKRRNLKTLSSLLQYYFEDLLSKNRLSRTELGKIYSFEAMKESGIIPSPAPMQTEPKAEIK